MEDLVAPWSCQDTLRAGSTLHRVKVIMQGKLIAVAYSLRRYGNQFSLGGVCKQE